MKNQSNINENTTVNITESNTIIHRCKQQHHTYPTINPIASLWEHHGCFLFWFNNFTTTVISTKILNQKRKQPWCSHNEAFRLIVGYVWCYCLHLWMIVWLSVMFPVLFWLIFDWIFIFVIAAVCCHCYFILLLLVMQTWECLMNLSAWLIVVYVWWCCCLHLHFCQCCRRRRFYFISISFHTLLLNIDIRPWDGFTLYEFRQS